MSAATKRRFITRQVESELVLPEAEDKIAQIIGTRGNNLHEVEDADGEKYLASMPTKFRKSVWVKRGQFVFLRPIEEGDKVKAEISHILDDENILYIYQKKLWPQRFEAEAERKTRAAKRESSAGSTKKHEVIDADMLPPSEDEDEEDDSVECQSEGSEVLDEEADSDGEEENEEDPIIETYNPNRAFGKH